MFCNTEIHRGGDDAAKSTIKVSFEGVLWILSLREGGIPLIDLVVGILPASDSIIV